MESSETVSQALRLMCSALLAALSILMDAASTTDDAGVESRSSAISTPAALRISRNTRLMVVAPHPDDEVLGAGGFMQRVDTLHRPLRIVYVNDGDGYPEGVQAEDHVTTPTPADYRGYGRLRRNEARAALAALKLGNYSNTFLGFPDGGLCTLMTKYWSDRAPAYRSPFTRLDRPPRSEVLVPNTEYRGEDLTQ